MSNRSKSKRKGPAQAPALKRADPPSPEKPVDLDQKLASILKGENEGSLTVALQRHISRSGPLPAPEDFEHYERVLPGGADRILKMAENEQTFRHKMTEKDLTCFWQDQSKRRNHVLVFALAVCGLAGTMAYAGFPLEAASIVALTVLGSYLSCRIDEKTVKKREKEKDLDEI